MTRLLKAVLRASGEALWVPCSALRDHRALFALLMRREVVSRTSGTWLGGLWMLAQPALQVVALWFLLDVVLKVRFPGQAPFLNYFLVGMLPWLMVNEVLQRNLQVLSEFGALYQRTAFPLAILPLLPLAVTGLTYGGIYAVVVGLLEGPGAFFRAPLAVAAILLWLLPFSYLFAVVGLFLRDARQLIPFVLTLLMYVTPIMYLPDALPHGMRILLPLNPLADIMTLLHGLLQGMPWGPGNLLRPLALWLLLLGPAWLLFRRAEPHMREEL